MALTDEQIANIASTPCAVVGSYVHTFARAIESAACAERDARIAELEAMLRAEADARRAEINARLELERQLAEARNQALEDAANLFLSQDRFSAAGLIRAMKEQT